LRIYLVIVDPKNGMAELNNVGMVSADTREEAVSKMAKVEGYDSTDGIVAFSLNEIKVLTQIKGVWRYYE